MQATFKCFALPAASSILNDTVPLSALHRRGHWDPRRLVNSIRARIQTPVSWLPDPSIAHCKWDKSLLAENGVCGIEGFGLRWQNQKRLNIKGREEVMCRGSQEVTKADTFPSQGPETPGQRGFRYVLSGRSGYGEKGTGAGVTTYVTSECGKWLLGMRGMKTKWPSMNTPPFPQGTLFLNCANMCRLISRRVIHVRMSVSHDDFSNTLYPRNQYQESSVCLRRLARAALPTCLPRSL